MSEKLNRKVKKSDRRKQTNMIKYIIKRILIMIPTFIFGLIITFALSNMMNVSPILNRVDTVRPDIIELEKIRTGFYDPWYIKLLKYLENFFTGNWGNSYVLYQEKPVLEVIAEILPKTFELMIVPSIISPIIAVKMGASAAKHKDKLKDNVIRLITIVAAGFPLFWIATVLQLVFGEFIPDFTNNQFRLPVLFTNEILELPGPINGFRTNSRIIDSILYNDQEFLWDTILHIILPSICMVFVSLAGVSRLTRSSMLEILDSDYIRTARAKGVKEDDVINKHALRNSLIPTSNLIVGSFGGAFLGSLFIETSFQYRGFGYWMMAAINNGDYLVINGFTVIAIIITLISVLLADVMYTIIDPRIIYN